MGDSRHTQSIQINRVIGENEKHDFFYRKNHRDFLANPIVQAKTEISGVCNRKLRIRNFQASMSSELTLEV